ncbi:PilW family protein [Ectothiorhodospira shaposhnikovii]|uniref:PilW family protein n=1 Tax=Ectothiorhodospira shaposhnikovii TaxID=1054 RepID=UPI001EE7B97B|nr:prepilin-type N-terminal cleavage/methylation domain-containing protein [Ectothiorhodospira shaposhnikovii]MCG5513285.1 prepilin-type N-terminal cleavage/methylation domain-containing protein [Ectothiorhodospira shaposhnikovii]
MSRAPTMGFPAHRSHGLSLVELMVALLIGLILLVGVVNVFLGNQVSYRESQRLSQLQESIGYAVDFIARDVRGASGVVWDENAGVLAVTRSRDTQWCNVGAGDQALVYFVQGNALFCGASTANAVALVPAVEDASLDVTLLPADPLDASSPIIGLWVEMTFLSRATQGEAPLEHRLGFHVALRNEILRLIYN